jgi:hypothetical protein
VDGIEKMIPVIAAVGFGIQQFLQVIVDPLASATISAFKNRHGAPLPDGTPALPGGISDVDAKKALLGGVSLLLGLMISLSAPALRILAAAGLKDLPNWDLFITALTISAGTEGVNSVVKLVQYVKDAVKAKTPPSVAQNSPVPQAPTRPAEAGKFTADPNNPGLVDIDATEQAADIQSRAKEVDYET